MTPHPQKEFSFIIYFTKKCKQSTSAYSGEVGTVSAGNPYWRETLSTVDLLVQTSLEFRSAAYDCTNIVYAFNKTN